MRKLMSEISLIDLVELIKLTLKENENYYKINRFMET